VSAVVCEGCGRVGGEREVYCAACGRLLPGRTEAQSDAAPPGWLVSPTARDQAGPYFKPMPSVPVADAEAPSPGYRIIERPQRDPAAPLAPPPPPLPLAGVEPAASGAAAAPLGARTPPLRALLLPLLVLAVGSSLGAVALLVLHVLHDR
jgi:hypothetical protein